MSDRFTLDGKRILVTGGSSGIGQEIAAGCSAMGGHVVITARSLEKLEQTAAMCSNATIVSADLLCRADVVKLIDSLPELDGLVLCAGMNKKEPVNFITEDNLNMIMNTNFTSNAMLVKALLKAKKIRKGSSIVIISSVSVDIPAAGNAIYAASKGAISSYMRVLALELSRKDIRVNSIEPGMVKTPWLEKSVTTAEQFAKDEARYPLGRYGTPEDIANAAIYMLSDAAAWMTGSVLRIDGGISLI